MFLNGVSCDRNPYFDKISCLNKNNDKPIEIKVFKLKQYDRIAMIKCLNPHYYAVFEVGEKNTKLLIEEKELLK